MAVTHDDVRKMAALARLAVPVERLDALAAELNGILQHMDALARVDVTGDAAEAGEPAAGMRLSPDAGPSVPLTRTLEAIAPAWREGFFLVPRLDTHGAAGAAADEPQGDHA